MMIPYTVIMMKTALAAAVITYTAALVATSFMADRVTTICMPARIKMATVINRRIP